MLIVFGALCTDFFLNVEQHPTTNGPVVAEEYHSYPGGRGGNQALAAARTGVRTAIVGMVGDDLMGTRLAENLKRDGVITSGLGHSDECDTGANFVAIDQKGQRRNYQALGANIEATSDQIPDEILNEAAMLVLQMDLPVEQNIAIMERAKAQGAKILMNLSPMAVIPRKALSMIDYLVVNQIEAREIAQMMQIDCKNNAVMIAQALAKEGDLTCIVTIGERGSVAAVPEGTTIGVDALKLADDELADIWGSSDVYCGTLAGCLYQEMEIGEAMRHASVAATLTCKKPGTQTAFPYWDDVERLLCDLPEASPTSV